MSYDASTRTNRELLSDWAAIMRQLRARDIIRTNNSPTGDIAEALVARALGGVRGHFSQAGWDVRVPATPEFPDGERVQVKSLRVVSGSKAPTTCSPIVDQDYDCVVVVIFDEDFRVTEALRFTRAVVERLFSPRPRDGARIISVTRRLRLDADVHAIDVADDMLDRSVESTA